MAGVGSSVAKGASFGSALGTVVPGVGNVVGGAIGAIGGAVVGLIKRKKEKEQEEKEKEQENKKQEDMAGGLKAAFGAVPGMSTAGRVAGAALGAGQMVAGMIQEKKADALIPAVEDKMSRDYLEQIRRKRRAAETNTSGSAATAALRQTVKSIGANSFKSGGGGSTSVLSQVMADQNAALRDKSAQEQLAYLDAEGKQVSEMAQRKSDIGMFRANQKFAKSAANKAAGPTNFLASIGGKASVPKDQV